MTQASSISQHLISFDGPEEVTSLYAFPTTPSDQDELESAKQQIADLQRKLKRAEDAASAGAQAEIEALVKKKDEELQEGMDELRATYEAKVGHLAEETASAGFEAQQGACRPVGLWSRPVLKTLSTKQMQGRYGRGD